MGVAFGIWAWSPDAPGDWVCALAPSTDTASANATGVKVIASFCMRLSFAPPLKPNQSDQTDSDKAACPAPFIVALTCEDGLGLFGPQ
jgi:hypothetical protein